MGGTPVGLSRTLRKEVLRKRARAELDRSQWLPQRELELLQMRRLRALLKHAYESVPYYRKMFNERNLRPEDIRSPRDLLKIPVLKKEDVRTHTEEMISLKYNMKDLEEMRTSGSTSIPLKVYRNIEMGAYSHAGAFRHRSWMKIKNNDIAAYLGPPGLDRYPPEIPEPLRLYTWEMTSEKLTNLLENIRKYKPKLLRGFSSGLSLLTRFCEERGLDDVSFQCISSSGEKLFENEKRRMENIFKTEVYQLYAATDTGIIAYDCPHHSGLHICSEYMFIEFLKDGELAEVGEMASVVVTPLFSYGMPLIRYDLEDAAYRMDEPCPCGRGLPLMSYIDGRITDILVAPDGRWLGDSNFRSRIFEHIDVQQYRIIQENIYNIEVELIPGKNYDEKAEKFIIESIKKYMGEHVKTSVKLTDKIEATPSGKRRVVVSHVPVKLL